MKGRKQEEMVAGETRMVLMMGGPRSRSSQAGSQSATRMMAHSRVKGGKSHGGDLSEDSRGTIDI